MTQLPEIKHRIDSIRNGLVKRNHPIQSLLYVWLITLHHVDKTSPTSFRVILRPAVARVKCLIRLWEDTKHIPGEEYRNTKVWDPIIQSYGFEPSSPAAIVMIINALKDLSEKGTILGDYITKNENALGTQHIGADYLKVLQPKKLQVLFKAISEDKTDDVEKLLAPFGIELSTKILNDFYHTVEEKNKD